MAGTRAAQAVLGDVRAITGMKPEECHSAVSATGTKQRARRQPKNAIPAASATRYVVEGLGRRERSDATISAAAWSG